LILVEKRES